MFDGLARTSTSKTPSWRMRWSRLLRRHRRLLAATLTGVGVLCAIAALRPTPPPPPDPPDPRLPPAGQVALPVELASGSTAALLKPGDRVDVVTVESIPSVILARDAMVLLPTAGSGFVGASSSVVLLAMSEAAALQVAGTSGAVTVLLQPAAEPAQEGAPGEPG